MSEKIESPKLNKSNKNDVMDVYNEYRTARLNIFYYEDRLHWLRFWNFWIELLLAFTVSSGFASLWIWNTAVGGYVWKILLAIASALAIAKPLLSLSEKIQQDSEVITKWRALHNDLQMLTYLISLKKRYDDDMQKQFLKLLGDKFAINEPTDQQNLKLVGKYWEVVNNELPIENFFVPEEQSNAVS